MLNDDHTLLYFMYACIQRKTWIEDSCWLSKANSTGCEHIWAEHHLGAAVSDLLAVVASVSGLLLLYMYATHCVQQWHPSTSVTIGHQKWYSTYCTGRRNLINGVSVTQELLCCGWLCLEWQSCSFTLCFHLPSCGTDSTWQMMLCSTVITCYNALCL